LDARRKLVSRSVFGKISIGGKEVGVGVEVEEEHHVSMHVIDRGHIVAVINTPFVSTAMASSNVAWVTDANNSFIAVIEYSKILFCRVL